MVTERIIDPVKFVKPYFDEETSEEDIEALIGLLIILKEGNVKTLARTIGLKHIEIEEMLGRLIQSGLFIIEFKGLEYKIIRTTFKPKLEVKQLTVQDQFFISYIKARHKLSLREIAEVFEIKSSEAMKKVAIFVCRGMIEIIQQEEDYYFFIVKYRNERKTVETLSFLDIQLIGYLLLKGVTTIEEISLDLDIPNHKVLSVLVDLLLSETIICYFDYQKNFLRENTLSLKIRQANVTFPQKSIEALNEQQRLVLGIVALSEKIAIDRLISLTGLPRPRIIEILCNMTAMTQYRFLMNFNEDIFVEDLPNFSPNKTLQDMEHLYFFNYKELLGRISTQKRVRLKQLAKKMRISKQELLRRIVDLYLEGHLKGRLLSTEEFVVKTIRKSDDLQSGTLTDEERIIIGALIATKSLTWPEIGALLKIDRENAITIAYSMVAKNIGNIQIFNEKRLVMTETPNLPPLITIDELSYEDQVLLGYLASATNPNLKEAKTILRKPRVNILSKVYFLIGSGLLVAQQHKQRFTIKRVRIEEPHASISQKSTFVQSLAHLLDEGIGKKVSIKKLAKELKEDTRIVVQTILYLVANGFLIGKLKGNNFQVTRTYIKFTVDQYCYFCNQKLEDINEPCPNCGNLPIHCTVCRGAINAIDSVLKCPTCQNLAHPEHLEEWLNLKGECPICKMRLRLNQFISIEAPLKL